MSASALDQAASVHQRLRTTAGKDLSSRQDDTQQDGNREVPSRAMKQALESEPHSGTATPIASDAPLSQQATSSVRQKLRAEQKKRTFPTIEYSARVSHFDPASDYRDFRGFFVLFWIGLAIMCITTMLRNMKETGYPFQMRQKQTFVENVWEMAFSDAIMSATTLVNLPLHNLYANSKGWLRWSKGGKWVQAIFQAAWLFYWVE